MRARFPLLLLVTAVCVVLTTPARSQAPDPGIDEPPPPDPGPLPVDLPAEEPPPGETPEEPQQPEEPPQPDEPESSEGDAPEGTSTSEGSASNEGTPTTGAAGGGDQEVDPARSFTPTSNARPEPSSPAGHQDRGYDGTLPYGAPAEQTGASDLSVAFSVGGGLLLLVAALQMRYVAMRAGAKGGA